MFVPVISFQVVQINENDMNKFKTITFSILLGVFLCISDVNSQSMVNDSLQSIALFSSLGQDSVSCYRIPAFTTATNGDLIVAVDERVPSCNDLRGSRNINIVIRRSSDKGNNWTPITRIVDFPDGQSASDPSFIVDQETHTIWLFYNYMNLDRAPNIYRLHVMYSKDYGHSWSSPRDITPQITAPEWYSDFMFITSGRGTQTKDGLMLHCLVNLDKGMHLFGSKDHGESWFWIDTPIEPADESKIIVLEDGTWLINSRVRAAGMRYTHRSVNQGKSWVTNQVLDLPDPACNASILSQHFEEEQWLIFSNAKDAKERKNLTITLSKDGGKTWPSYKVIDQGFAAYSSMTMISKNEIGLIYEAKEYQTINFVKIPWSWLEPN